MAVTASRKIVILFTEDIAYGQSFAAASNVASPGDIDVLSLEAGANTISVPGGGSTVKGMTIIPPANNDIGITLKGVSGDTGIAISKTDPTSIGFETAPASIVLDADDAIVGLRIIWT